MCTCSRHFFGRMGSQRNYVGREWDARFDVSSQKVRSIAAVEGSSRCRLSAHDNSNGCPHRNSARIGCRSSMEFVQHFLHSRSRRRRYCQTRSRRLRMERYNPRISFILSASLDQQGSSRRHNVCIIGRVQSRLSSFFAITVYRFQANLTQACMIGNRPEKHCRRKALANFFSLI